MHDVIGKKIPHCLCRRRSATAVWGHLRWMLGEGAELCLHLDSASVPLPPQAPRENKAPLSFQGILAEGPAPPGGSLGLTRFIAKIVAISFLSTCYWQVWFCTISLSFSLLACRHKEHRIQYKVHIQMSPSMSIFSFIAPLRFRIHSRHRIQPHCPISLPILEHAIALLSLSRKESRPVVL